MLDDVLAAIDNATLLRPPAPIIAESSLLVIDDFAEAMRRSREGGAWMDLRQREVERLLAATHAAPNGMALREAVRGLGEPLRDLVASRVPPRYAEIAAEVAADLQNIVLDRAVPGAGSGLFTRMWLVYVQGGWPCGMDGERLVAFSPPLSPESIEVQ